MNEIAANFPPERPEGSRGPIGIAAGTQSDRAPDGAPADRYTFKPLQ